LNKARSFPQKKKAMIAGVARMKTAEAIYHRHTQRTGASPPLNSNLARGGRGGRRLRKAGAHGGRRHGRTVQAPVVLLPSVRETVLRRFLPLFFRHHYFSRYPARKNLQFLFISSTIVQGRINLDNWLPILV
jgi:hypothetical protein